MLRHKILGPNCFHKNTQPAQNRINSDLGHFSIFSDEECEFETVPLPPKQLWVNVRLEFCDDVPILNGEHTGKLCKKVSVIPEKLINEHWQLQESIFEHHFAVAPVMHKDDILINLWPCGGLISNNFSEIEQMYAQLPNDDSQIYINSLSAYQQYPCEAFVFQKPDPQNLSLAAAISKGLMKIKLFDKNAEYTYTSCATDGKILFKRN